MCHMYASTDPAKYECTTRSVRLRGCVTSVRLENEFWDILDDIASGQQLSTAQFITELHREVTEIRGDVANLASLLRVACAVHQQNSIRQAPSETRASVG
ncbi:ribbon-helix-helix domain-containing protein [Halomonas sp. V046]|uniref:ribbon-helix-helix domain-containing protein n=1 Tax=Halomonas sp. V046 TaxID=3459611 RepID=UPI0040449F2F